MVENIINDIVRARDNNAYISALALALTLPNILSNIEYEKETHKEEYIAWFDKWVYKYYEYGKSENTIVNLVRDNTKFDGANCYALRCALLHSGNTYLQNIKGKKTIDRFELNTSIHSPYSSDAVVCDITEDGVSNVYVTLNVVGLIDSLLAGAIEYISMNKNKVSQYGQWFGGIEIRTNQYF